MSLFEPIERQTAPTVVYDRLRRSILHGRLVVGSALREAALAREFGASRSPLREGLHRLEEE
ncbi:MAG: GntR family transcriptional regulator, partial [Pseudonocardia sp.]|nr:GntR family transcriptional regulator [Pseudonocardia sp.]